MFWDEVQTTYFRENRRRSSLGQRELAPTSHKVPSSSQFKNKSPGMKANGDICKDRAAQYRGWNKAKTSLKMRKCIPLLYLWLLELLE